MAVMKAQWTAQMMVEQMALMKVEQMVELTVEWMAVMKVGLREQKMALLTDSTKVGPRVG